MVIGSKKRMQSCTISLPASQLLPQVTDAILNAFYSVIDGCLSAPSSSEHQEALKRAAAESQSLFKQIEVDLSIFEVNLVCM